LIPLVSAVGGNHEAANHLWELHYGGWVAPNIYYLGAAGVVRFGGLRIAGLSGIYNPRHYRLVTPCAPLMSCPALDAISAPS
jgi:lariat debranching enzyme